MDSKSDEASLIRRLKRRDEAAFATMVRQYQGRVFALVFRMLGDRAEAEDLAQEVFVTVFKSIDSFRGEARFSTWLYRIAANHSKNRIKYLGRRHHQRTRSLDDARESDFRGGMSSAHARPDELATGRELEGIIQECLARLDDDQRVVIILRDLEQLSYAEIAEITDVAEGTVKSRLFRGRAALRALIRQRVQR